MPATAAVLQAWISAASWPRLVTYSLLATALHGALITLIIQRRDLSSLDNFVFFYLVVHLAVDALRLLVGLVILLRRGTPRLANLQDCEFPGLTVVIPCHNEAEVISDTIRSLQAVDYPDLRIIVVDDGSSDGTAAIAAACRPPVRVVCQRAAGKAAALNAGLAAVETPLTSLVDADCLFPRDGFRDAVRHLLGEKDVIPGALGLFRTSALRAAGPLSTTHLAEDVALTARLVEQGWRLAFSPYLQAETVVPDALPNLRIQRRRWVRGYAQVAFEQLFRVMRINGRARMAALAMAIKTLRWPLEFALSLVYSLHAWSQGQPAVLLLSLLAMLFPFSLRGLSRFLRSDGSTLVMFTYWYGMILLGWQVWDQLTLLITPSPRWEPYRRRQAKPSP